MSPNGVELAFELARKRNGLAVVGYLPAGWPSEAGFAELADAAFSAGLDVLEVGVPCADPFLDGEVIRDAMAALSARGVSALAAVESAGASAAPGRPLVAMMYRADWLGLGGAALPARLATLGYSGMLVVGTEPGDWAEYAPAARAAGLSPIAFADGSVAGMAAEAGGFVYLPSYRGKTGRKADFGASLGKRIDALRREAGGLPVAVGFGVNSPGDVAALAGLGADGAIVGTAFLKAAADPEGLARFVGSLKEAAVRGTLGLGRTA